MYRKRAAHRIVLCRFCGREIGLGEEYWACNGRLVCSDCLPELARLELWPCREVRGKEVRL